MASIQSTAVRDSAFRMTLHSEIEIAATPRRIWDVLTDFGDYPNWNAAIPSARGEAMPGTMLQVVIQWPGLKSSGYRLEILAARPEQELRWLGHYKVVGLLDGDHRFLIEPVAADRTRVIQREDFSGVLVPVFAPWLRRNVLDGFDQMNAALKVRAQRSLSPPAP